MGGAHHPGRAERRAGTAERAGRGGRAPSATRWSRPIRCWRRSGMLTAKGLGLERQALRSASNIMTTTRRAGSASAIDTFGVSAVEIVPIAVNFVFPSLGNCLRVVKLIAQPARTESNRMAAVEPAARTDHGGNSRLHPQDHFGGFDRSAACRPGRSAAAADRRRRKPTCWN